MVPKFISDTYACIIGRGTHKCFKKTQYYMRCMRKLYGDYYIIKLDIKKYFFNIDRNILYNILKENFKDKKVLKLAKIILGDFREKGIPIGNYTSQYFANIYLSKLDYFIKFDLKIKYYCRYMDDFVILVPDKESACCVYTLVRDFLGKYLLLELNKKSRYYPSRLGCNFCGFIIYEDYVLLRKRFKRNIKRDVLLGKEVVSSYKGHLMWANCYNFVKKLNL